MNPPWRRLPVQGDKDLRQQEDLKHEFVGNYQFNVARVTYAYVCRGADGRIMARCESVEDARLVARLLEENEKREKPITGAEGRF